MLPLLGFALLSAMLTPIDAAEAKTEARSALDVTDESSLDHFIRQQWSTREGLPHNSVNAIVQDNAGYLWLGTWQGPTRFNGHEFEIYDDVRVTGLPDIGIFTVDINPCNGSLYVAGARGGISRFDEGQWRKLEPAPPFINQVNADRHCNLWVASSEQGLLFYENDKRTVQFTTDNGLPSNAVFQSLLDDQGNLWAATGEGLAVKTTDSTHFELIEDIPPTTVKELHQGPTGRIWVGTQNGIYQQSTQNLHQFYVTLPEVDGSISTLHHAPSGALWIGTYRSGVWRLFEGRLESLNVADGLPNNHVLDIQHDHEGSIWVSTHGGLVQFRDGLFNSFNQRHGLAGNYARSVWQWRDQVYVGTSAGISKLSQDGVADVGVGTALANQSVLGFTTYDDKLVVGTYTGGAFVWDGHRVTEQLNTDNGLPANEVRNLAVHPTYGLLLGGPGGITHRQADGDLHTINTDDGLHNDYTTALTVDSQGTVWTGSVSGVSKITIDGPADEPSYQVEAIDLSALNDAQLAFQIEEKAGYVWFASDRGLISYHQKSDSWRIFNRDNGLPFDNFLAMAFDGHGNLWLGSNRGAILIAHDDLTASLNDPATQLKYQRYTEVDGMSNAQVNSGSPSMFRSQQGNVWMATAQGVSVIDPNNMNRLVATPPPADVAEVVADGQHLRYGQTLEADTQRVVFDYAGLGYLMSDHIQYQVRLIGFDNDWVDKGSVTRAEYTALPANDYLFQVRAAYPGGQWSEPDSFAFSRSETFWQRPSTWLLLAVLSFLLIFVTVRARIRWLTRSRQQLELMVKEKTAELESIARQDPLTGLGNRRAFDEHLQHEVKRSLRNGSSVSLAILDVDFFKQINDRFLHTVGDQVLVELANLLNNLLREVDYAARWGGEEFAILLPETSLTEAVEVAERIRRAVAEYDLSNYLQDCQLTVSIGLASTEEHPDHSGLLVAADKALYQAKANGRNRTEYK